MIFSSHRRENEKLRERERNFMSSSNLSLMMIFISHRRENEKLREREIL